MYDKQWHFRILLSDIRDTSDNFDSLMEMVPFGSFPTLVKAVTFHRYWTAKNKLFRTDSSMIFFVIFIVTSSEIITESNSKRFLGHRRVLGTSLWDCEFFRTSSASMIKLNRKRFLGHQRIPWPFGKLISSKSNMFNFLKRNPSWVSMTLLLQNSSPRETLPMSLLTSAKTHFAPFLM